MQPRLSAFVLALLRPMCTSCVTGVYSSISEAIIVIVVYDSPVVLLLISLSFRPSLFVKRLQRFSSTSPLAFHDESTHDSSHLPVYMVTAGVSYMSFLLDRYDGKPHVAHHNSALLGSRDMCASRWAA